jgi:hypothetical protein
MNRLPRATQTIYPYTAEYGVRLDQALSHARLVPDEELLRLPLDAISESLVDQHAAAPVVIQFDQMWWEMQESPIRSGPPDGGLGVAVKFFLPWDAPEHFLRAAPCHYR